MTHLCLPDLLGAQARKSPAATAVLHLDRRITYRELDDRASVLADRARAAGAGPETILALLGKRDPDFLIGMLAILKSGAAFLPVSDSSPGPWIADVLRDSSAVAVVSGQKVTVTGPVSRQTHPAALSLSNLAYVIYTSGSTGKPKGAMIEHRGLRNHIEAKISHLKLGAADVVAQTAPQSFDISIWQFLAPLMVGGVVAIIPDEQASDPERLLQEVVDRRITILEVVPSLLRVLLEVSLPPASQLALRALLVTGEAVAPDLCRRWLDRYPYIPVVNAYGPTECSDDVTHYDIVAPEDLAHSSVPVGYPIPGIQIHLVGPEDRTELCVSGAALGRGYLGDPARTAVAFVPNPEGDPGSRLYRTGDLACRLPSGALVLLGRLDDQLKIRGCRIEPAEIEAALEQHPGVRQAAVVAKHLGGSGERRLIAYIASGPGVNAGALRRHARQCLPWYMVPSIYVLLDAVPLTPHGKLDRHVLAELPLPQSSDPPPGNAEEAAIADLWGRLLAAPSIPFETSFFDLGGDSLLLTHMQRELAQMFQREIPAVELYAHPTVRSLADYLRGKPAEVGLASVAARAEMRTQRRRRGSG